TCHERYDFILLLIPARFLWQKLWRREQLQLVAFVELAAYAAVVLALTDMIYLTDHKVAWLLRWVRSRRACRAFRPRGTAGGGRGAAKPERRGIMNSRRGLYVTLFGLFLASGFCGLLYQVVWLRLAFAAFGVITPVLSIVLS